MEEDLRDAMLRSPPRDVSVTGEQAEHAIVTLQHVSAELADSALPARVQELP
jgi:hypothetical protein